MSDRKNLLKAALLVLTLVILVALFSCKNENKETPKPSCDETQFTGLWAFVINKDKANEYTLYLDIEWMGNTYTINNQLANRGTLGSTKVVYSTSTETFQIDLTSCTISSSGAKGQKL